MAQELPFSRLNPPVLIGRSFHCSLCRWRNESQTDKVMWPKPQGKPAARFFPFQPNPQSWAA